VKNGEEKDGDDRKRERRNSANIFEFAK
jgi:hypothetical protein